MTTHHSDSLLLDPHFVHDPFPKLAELRDSEPLYWDPTLETWFVTRHADVRQFLADPRLTNDRRIAPDYVEPEPGTWLAHFEQQSILNATPEEHRRWRSRVSAGFTPRSVRRMEGQVRDVVEAFAAPLRGRRGPVDLLSLFTSPIPNTVIGRITGIPPYPGDEERFRTLAQDMMRRYVFFADEANVRRGEAAIDELAEWVFKLADERRAAPREDLLSDLIEGNQGEDAMSNFEIVVLVAGLVAAGSETTTLGGSQVLRPHPMVAGSDAALKDEATGDYALHTCIAKKFWGAVPVLLEHGAGVNQLDAGSSTSRGGCASED